MPPKQLEISRCLIKTIQMWMYRHLVSKHVVLLPQKHLEPPQPLIKLSCIVAAKTTGDVFSTLILKTPLTQLETSRRLIKNIKFRCHKNSWKMSSQHYPRDISASIMTGKVDVLSRIFCFLATIKAGDVLTSR